MKAFGRAFLWCGGLLLAVACVAVGLVWNPDRYQAVQSDRPDPVEAGIENEQNVIVVHALNTGRIRYHPSMEKLARPRPRLWIFGVDLARTLLLSTLPVVIMGLVIRKILRARRKR